MSIVFLRVIAAMILELNISFTIVCVYCFPLWSTIQSCFHEITLKLHLSTYVPQSMFSFT